MQIFGDSVCLTKCVYVCAKLGGLLGFRLLVYLVVGKHNITILPYSFQDQNNLLLKGLV